MKHIIKLEAPLLYETHAPLVDINNQTEFEVAQILYAHYENLKQKGINIAKF